MRILFSLLIAMVLLGLNSAPAMASELAAPVLAVEGRGVVHAVPNQATLLIGVTSYAKNVQQAQSDNAGRAADIQAKLRKLGVLPTDIQTRDYSFYPAYREDTGKEPKITGYTVDNTVVVKIKNIDEIGTIIDAVLVDGANRINGLTFSTTENEKFGREALLAAVNDARNKADIIAAGLGRQIIGIKSVTENGGVRQSRGYDNMMMDSSAKATPIAAGTLELSASVNIEYLLSN